jgi:hypothetical protein
MRTTIDIDDALLERLRAAAHREGVAFRTLLHRVLRRGLAERVAEREPGYVVPSRRMGRVRDEIDLGKALRTADALEDEERVRKMHLRK